MVSDGGTVAVHAQLINARVRLHGARAKPNAARKSDTDPYEAADQLHLVSMLPCSSCSSLTLLSNQGNACFMQTTDA